VEEDDYAFGRKEKRDENYEKKLRQDALKGIISAIKGNKDFYNNNHIEDCIDLDGFRRTKSLYPNKAEKEEYDRGPHSYPMTPRARKEVEEQNGIPIMLQKEIKQDVK
jgi:hypothetical protein